MSRSSSCNVLNLSNWMMWKSLLQMSNETDETPQLPEGLDASAIPKHVAIIMDGNSRWAERRGLPASMGHEAGVRSLKEVVKLAHVWGIKVLTVFAFSTENWLRPTVKPRSNPQ
jgi:ditrans,polycis-polyprenyl diphosphate synthase